MLKGLRFIMKNRFIYRLLSLCVLTAATLISASISKNIFACPVKELVSRLEASRGIIIRAVDRKRQDTIFENYQCLNAFMEDQYFKLFVRTYCTTPYEFDSALFLKLISHVNSFYMASNNKQIDSFKESLLKRMISLRSVEEFRNDKYLAERFDDYFCTNVKNLLRQVYNFKRNGEKTQNAVDLRFESIS